MNKYKQAAESWLRAIIADEVAKINTSLVREREHLATSLAELEQAVQHLHEVKENHLLRDHIKQLHGKLADVEATFRKLHPKEGLPQ
jgi:hypothetical protein